MGWTSQDNLIDDLTNNGQGDVAFCQKTLTAVQIAGTWCILGPHGNTPPASTYAGASLTYVPTDDTWSEGVIWTGGDKDPETKHFLSAGASVVAAAGAPWYIMAIDLVGYVPLTGADVSTTGTKTVTMTAIGAGAGTGDRYPNGEGLRLFVAADTAMGANAPTCIVNYLDTGGGAGATTTFTSTASLPLGAILNSGAAANKHNPFLPLAAGDTGVSDIVSLVWAGTAHASGTVIIGLCKPLWVIPVPATGLYTKVDFVNSLPSMRQIKDGANIQYLMFQTGATTSAGIIMVDFDYAWG
ncbi:MAG: hypothetical protein IPG84_18170 [Betaproteobacteria bacterium]|nr:hypothetical protein [Betaproteobacteria bacterium]